MNNLFSLIGSLLILILQAIVVSAFFTACQWLLSLMDIAGKPTWSKFLYGSLGIFCFLFIVSCCKTAIEMYRMYKDPIYKEAAIRTGINWNSYKRISIKKNDESEKSYNNNYVKFKGKTFEIIVVGIAVFASYLISSEIRVLHCRAEKYVYYEPLRRTIHADRKCKDLDLRRNHIYQVKLSEFVDWRDNDLANTAVKDFCHLCVSGEDYDFITKSIQEQIFDKYDSRR